jgi:hypothetical protein
MGLYLHRIVDTAGSYQFAFHRSTDYWDGQAELPAGMLKSSGVLRIISVVGLTSFLLRRRIRACLRCALSGSSTYCRVCLRGPQKLTYLHLARSAKRHARLRRLATKPGEKCGLKYMDVQPYAVLATDSYMICINIENDMYKIWYNVNLR